MSFESQRSITRLAVKNKDVLREASSCPKGLMQWLAANNKELENLITRGVLKLVKMSELQNLPKDSYELIPSLVVYSKKSTGASKSRLVACGNYQIPTDSEKEEVFSFHMLRENCVLFAEQRIFLTLLVCGVTVI